MTNFPELPITVRAGASLQSMQCRPIEPYSPLVIEFLAELSRDLMARPDSRLYPDVAAFAFWCRQAHLQSLANTFDRQHLRVGRGLALHIAPGNVPVNFAFTLAFGMLAGNANIVRVAEASRAQTDILCQAIDRLFREPAHAMVASMNRVVQYPRDDALTAALCARASARVLWGGDQTIAHLRALPAPPRCVDIAFADRYSIALLDAAAVQGESDSGIQALARGFFNDVYQQDQNACSSPHLVIWHGAPGQVQAAQQRFWPVLTGIVEQEYALAPIHAMDKLVHLCRTAATLPQAGPALRHANLVYRVDLQSLPADIEAHRGHAGFFFEHGTQDLDCLATIVDTRYQTLTCFGFDRPALARRVVGLGLTGIDRIVPVGQALAIGVVWDGYDLIATLSRIVHTA